MEGLNLVTGKEVSVIAVGRGMTGLLKTGERVPVTGVVEKITSEGAWIKLDRIKHHHYFDSGLSIKRYGCVIWRRKCNIHKG